MIDVSRLLRMIRSTLLLGCRVRLTPMATLRTAVDHMIEQHTGTVIDDRAVRKLLVPRHIREALRSPITGSQADSLLPIRVHIPLYPQNLPVRHHQILVTSALLTMTLFRHLQHPDPRINHLLPITHQARIHRNRPHHPVLMVTPTRPRTNMPMPRRPVLIIHSLHCPTPRTHRLRSINMVVSLFCRQVWRLHHTQVRLNKVSLRLPILRSHRHKARLQHLPSLHCSRPHTVNMQIAGTALSWAHRADLGAPIEVTMLQALNSGRTTGRVAAGEGVEAVVRITAPISGMLGRNMRL